jgi:hypothetical protein
VSEIPPGHQRLGRETRDLGRRSVDGDRSTRSHTLPVFPVRAGNTTRMSLTAARFSPAQLPISLTLTA